MLDGENKLILGAIRGESSAFGSLYDHYQPQIYRFIYLKVGRREEAEDLTHQVFLSAWNNVRSFKPQGFPFSSWLYEIARNKIIDYYRSKKNDASIDAISEDWLPTGEGPASGLETKLALEKVRKALLTLKPEYQEVIILRYVEDLSLKDVAEMIGKTEGAVKLLQHRAIRNLKQVIDKNT